MSRSLMAVVPHSRLMELKNSGAVDTNQITDAADRVFVKLIDKIIEVRKENEKPSRLARIFLAGQNVEVNVNLMFRNRSELVEHLLCVDVPTKLVPVTQDEKDLLLFLDRASRYSVESRLVLDMFRRHNEVIVDSDTSLIVDWVLRNAPRIRETLAKEVA